MAPILLMDPTGCSRGGKSFFTVGIVLPSFSESIPLTFSLSHDASGLPMDLL